MDAIKDIPVFILCGGKGTRIKEETDLIPKPMIPLGGQPILIHIMRRYAKFGFCKFVLCLGFKSEVIKTYFLNFSAINSDFTVDLKNQKTHFHSVNHSLDWEVSLIYTGETANTGSRIYNAYSKYHGPKEQIAVTYGDGLSDVNLKDEWEFHLAHNKIGTVLGINPPSRFGEIKLSGDEVTAFIEKPELKFNWISGGFFFFKKDFLSYLSADEDCVLEKKPLVRLAEDRQLNLYQHKGFWACMDTVRDREYLEGLLSEGQALWL